MREFRIWRNNLIEEKRVHWSWMNDIKDCYHKKLHTVFKILLYTYTISIKILIYIYMW